MVFKTYKFTIFPRGTELYIPHLTGVVHIDSGDVKIAFPEGTNIQSITHTVNILEVWFIWFFGAWQEGNGARLNLFVNATELKKGFDGIKVEAIKIEEPTVAPKTKLDGSPNVYKMEYYKAYIGDTNAHKVVFEHYLEIVADQDPVITEVSPPPTYPPTRTETETTEGMYEVMGQMMQFMMMFMMMGMMMSIVAAMMPSPRRE